MTTQKTTGYLRLDLERRILHGLACEWNGALWMLDTPHRVLMRRPLFSLQSMDKRLGYWSGEKREICLSMDLVFNHPWEAIREVLLHEMAHQFAEEVLGAHNEFPHGPTFQQACHLLRANPKASSGYKPLDERVYSDVSDPRNKIMMRVKKLLALAKSQNLFEAQTAMAKAHEFIAKYNLDIISGEKEREFVSVFLGKPALRHPRESYYLANLLQDFYFVHGIWISTFVLSKDKMGRVLEITGTVQNVRLAAYVYDYVKNFINMQWTTFNENKGLNRYRKTDYAVGVIDGFSSKLSAQKKKKQKSDIISALIKIQDPLLEKYTAHKYPNTIKVTKQALTQDDQVFRHGINAGKKLIIAKGISERKTHSNALIENK